MIFTTSTRRRCQCTALFSMIWLSSISQGQENASSDGTAWLPLTLNQSYQESLDKVTSHVSTRKGCGDVLQAKVSENSEKTNPKFIITCSGTDNSTLNFVYWQKDIDENFNGDSYPKKQERQVYSEAERIRLRLERLREENADLIEGCQILLQAKLGQRTAVFSESDVSISQRAEQTPVVYIDYYVGKSKYAPAYTATCRKSIDQSAQITTFPRFSP